MKEIENSDTPLDLIIHWYEYSFGNLRSKIMKRKI